MSENYAGCYTLHLYCQNRLKRDHTQLHSRASEYTGRTFTECAKGARKDGWKVFTDTRTALCPICAGRNSSDRGQQP